MTLSYTFLMGSLKGPTKVPPVQNTHSDLYFERDELRKPQTKVNGEP